MEVMDTQTRCEFISYKINDDLLAQVLMQNGIGEVSFENSPMAKATPDEDGLIISREGGEAELAELLLDLWCGGDLTGLDMSLLGDLQRGNSVSAPKADCRSYKLKKPYSGTGIDKLNVLHELFCETDIADRLDTTKTRSSSAGLNTPAGIFGFERSTRTGGGLSFLQLNAVGEGVSEDKAALLLKNGELTIKDTETFKWSDDSLNTALVLVGENYSPKGVTVLKQISCANVTKVVTVPAFLEISGGAMADCPALKEVNIVKRNVLLARGFVNSGVTVFGYSPSTAEDYCEVGGNNLVELSDTFPEPVSMEIAEGVWVTADSYAVFRSRDEKNAALSDLYYKPREGVYEEVDTEILRLSSDEARESGIASQLENFGRTIMSDTIRNDRSGYIRVSCGQSAADSSVYGCSLEIDHDGQVILVHSENALTAAQLANGCDKAIYGRFYQLGSTVTFGTRPETPVTPAEVPAIVFAAEPVAEPEVAAEPVAEPEVIAEPVAEPEVSAEPVAEPEAAAEPVAEPEVIAEPVAAPEVIAEPVIEPEIVAEPETAAEQESGEPQIIEAAPEDIRPAEETAEEPAAPESIKLVRGARFDLSSYAGKVLIVDMDYQAEEGLDIDGYIFLLAANGKVRSDADLVFFGQKASVDSAVINDPSVTRRFTVELGKVDMDITKLAVAFAIYGDKPEQTFSRVTKPTVRISCEGKEICSYELEGLSEEKSAVAAEFYNKGGWKLRTVGLGYKEALKTLCGSYGVEVK